MDREVRATDTDFPPALRGIPQAPGLLYVRGTLAAEAPRVAIVGSRAIPARRAAWARQAAAALARAGFEVVSGGARGADTAAHLGALEAGGRTVAVVASGLDRTYPRENRALFERIVASGGAVVSEYPRGSDAAAWHFPERNRIVAGLCQATVVVHAAAKSGALYTADAARAQGRRLFAVPGSEGNNQLLEGGAVSVQTAEELLAALGHAAKTRPVPKNLSSDEAALLALFGEDPIHLDELRRRSGLAPGVLFLALGRLELQKILRTRPGNWYLRG